VVESQQVQAVSPSPAQLQEWVYLKDSDTRYAMHASTAAEAVYACATAAVPGRSSNATASRRQLPSLEHLLVTVGRC
jgi:hypothetical protein